MMQQELYSFLEIHWPVAESYHRYQEETLQNKRQQLYKINPMYKEWPIV